MFQAGAIVGDWARHAFCLIEFEEARAGSIFVRRGRRISDWAPRIEHGFSQLVDWLWLLSDQGQTATSEHFFGTRHPDVYTLLVVGRDRGLSAIEQRRLAWRGRRVLIDSQRVRCCTFDQLAADLRSRLHRMLLTTSPAAP